MLKQHHAIYFEATRKCNLSCPACMSRNDSRGPELTKEQIIERILVPAWEYGSREIIFSGGEFLVRKDAFDLLEAAHRTGYMVRIASNGILLTDSMLSQLKNLLGSNLVISLGINSFENDNENTRQVTGEYAMDLIRRLKSNHVKVQVIVTIGKFNIHSFKNTVNTLIKLKIPYNRSPFVPRNSDRFDLMLNASELKDFFYPQLSSSVNGFVSFTPFFLPHDTYESISGQNATVNNVPTNPTIGCWCGSWIAINAEGETAPCPILLDAVSGGNVLTNNISDILLKSELFQRITSRNSFEGECGKCQFRFTCGGCRAVTYYLTGNVFGSDPLCFIKSLTPAELDAEKKKTSEIFRKYARLARYGKLFTPSDKKD